MTDTSKETIETLKMEAWAVSHGKDADALVYRLTDALTALQAERDAAVAAAYEAAANDLVNECKNYPDDVAWIVEDDAKAIRYLTPADATAALDRVKAEVWNAAIDAAAGYARRYVHRKDDTVEKSILALRKPQENSHD